MIVRCVFTSICLRAAVHYRKEHSRKGFHSGTPTDLCGWSTLCYPDDPTVRLLHHTETVLVSSILQVAGE